MIFGRSKQMNITRINDFIDNEKYKIFSSHLNMIADNEQIDYFY